MATKNSSFSDKIIGQDVIETVEMHTCCEPVRIVRSGYPSIEGSTILEKRKFAKKHLDHLRKRLIFEPRGSISMYAVLPVTPDFPEADLAVLFMHNEGYSTMCGHAVISIGRYALDYGLVSPVSPETRVNIQCPCGLVTAFVEYSNGKSGKVRFFSVPAYIFAQDLEIDLPGFGTIQYDIAYGGAFYAFANAKQFGLDLKTASFENLRSAGACLSNAVRKNVKLEHHESPDLAFLYGTILTDENDFNPSEVCASCCIFADAQIDRSPCGSGVTARVAIQFYKHNLELGIPRNFSGPSGGEFTATAMREEEYSAGKKGLIVEVSGHGYYSGASRISYELDDPHKDGVLFK